MCGFVGFVGKQKKDTKNKIIKKIWILWLTSITPSGIITELSQIIVFEKQTIKKNFRKMKFTVDKRQKIW